MSPCPRETISYRIKPGDTLGDIARRFNTTVSSLISLNSGIDPKNLRIDQIICIPVKRSVVPCPPGSRYTIKPGDTYSKLSRKYGLSVAAISSLNPSVDPMNLQVGQIICLPVRKRRRP